MSRKTWIYVIVLVALAGTLQACGGGGGGGTVDNGTAVATDTTPPTITAFTLPATAASLSVSISAFTANDNVAVTGFMITQSATPPAAADVGWTATAPAAVTAAAAGSQTFYPWAKDAAGNVAVGTPVTVTITLATPAVSVAVSAAGTDTTSAVGADATFTFAVAAVGDTTYTYNISGFGAGDKLVFPAFTGGANPLTLINPNPADGSVTVELRRGVGGQQFLITVVLSLTPAQDQQILDNDVASFNALFGANSIQQL